MKKILIPIDFTEVALNAIEYAYKLFSNENLLIVHSVSGLYSNKAIYLQPGMHTEGVLQDKIRGLVCERLKMEDLPETIEIRILHGETTSALSKVAKECDYIVMGTRDNYDLFDRWLGTTSLSVIKSVNIPVYLIPKSATYNGFEKALIASDYHLRNRDFLRMIYSWSSSHDAYLRFFHVTEEQDLDFEITRGVILEELQLINKEKPRMDITLGKGEKVSDEILNNAYNFGANLIIAIPKRQSFFNALFVKSVSKELIMKTRIPILFLPYENQF